MPQGMVGHTSDLIHSVGALAVFATVRPCRTTYRDCTVCNCRMDAAPLHRLGRLNNLKPHALRVRFDTARPCVFNALDNAQTLKTSLFVDGCPQGCPLV